MGIWCFAAPLTDLSASSVKDDYYENSIEKKEFDKSNWEKAKEGIDYTPPAIKRKQEEERANNANAGNASSNASSSNRRTRDYSNWGISVGEGGLSGFFKILLIILGIALVAMIIFRLAGGSFEVAAPEKNVNPRDVAGTVNIKKVEENIHKSDMEILIEKSLKEGNYMLTVRLYYLWAIKELSNKRLIKWKRDKTNRDYIREMRKTEFNKPFRDVTRIFERVWYGAQEELQQSDFLVIQKKLNDFIQQVKKK